MSPEFCRKPVRKICWNKSLLTEGSKVGGIG
jgi:hypothetical protein